MRLHHAFPGRGMTVTLTTLCLIGGCYSSGLSPREQPGRDFSTYALAMADSSLAELATTGDAKAPATTPPLVLPARVAVAQIREVAPPDEMIDALRKDSNAFEQVQPIPAALEPIDPVYYGSRRDNTPDDRLAASRRASMSSACGI